MLPHMRLTPIILVAAALSGCVAIDGQPGASESPAHTAGEMTPRTSLNSHSRREVVGYSVLARPIEALILGAGTEAVLLLATIHGDEAAGTPLLERLAIELERDASLSSGRRVVLVPCLNPDGMAAQTRGNSNGVDLNRNFPASNFRQRARNGNEPLSEPESRVVDALLRRFKPARVISIHQPLNCVDYDGPETARDLAEAMSNAGPLRVRKLGTRPGSMGAYVGEELGIPIITLELPGSASRMGEQTLWDTYGDLLIVATTFEASKPAGALSGDGENRP